ncbi:MAG: S1 family peptidase [Gemmatimonadaceae bacterium]
MNEPLFADVPRDHHIFEVVVPLLAIGKAGQTLASGTGFFIAPGLAITALHVLQDYWDRLLGEGLTVDTPSRGAEDGISLLAHQVIAGQHVRWDAVQMWAADPLDIAFVEFRRHDGVSPGDSWPATEFMFNPPRVGQRVFAVGFPKQECNDLGPSAISWRQEAKVAGGVVREVHLQHRDTARLRFPCFLTNARFDGGMSGGPVVTDEGRVCGIVCSNLPPSNPSEEHASYVSLFWPTLTFRFDQVPYAPPGTSMTFADFFARGYLDSPDWQSIRILEDGRTVSIRSTAS